jgi:hypothetical protein
LLQYRSVGASRPAAHLSEDLVELRHLNALGVVASLVLGFASVPAFAAAAGAAAPEYKTSVEEYDALKARANGGTKHTAATLPDWRGIWRRDIPQGMLLSYDTDNGSEPRLDKSYAKSGASLTPKYKAAFDAKVARIKKGIEWDRTSYCLPSGMPAWLGRLWLREFILTPEQTWMPYEQMQEMRRVYTDGRGHVSEKIAIPLWEGDSIGFWAGDTLVIHTTHMKAGDYSRGQPDFSYKVTTVEQWRKADPDHMEAKITVYDPDSLTKPYHATFRYGRIKDPDVRVDYNSCEEGNNAVRTAEGGTDYVLPGEPGYRDPDTLGIPEVALDSRPQ